jgi:hypothetical protein
MHCKSSSPSSRSLFQSHLGQMSLLSFSWSPWRFSSAPSSPYTLAFLLSLTITPHLILPLGALLPGRIYFHTGSLFTELVCIQCTFAQRHLMRLDSTERCLIVGVPAAPSPYNPCRLANSYAYQSGPANLREAVEVEGGGVGFGVSSGSAFSLYLTSMPHAPGVS